MTNDKPHKKIRLKKGVKLLAGLFVFFVLIGFVNKKQERRICPEINIHIDYGYDNYFIDENDVLDIMTSKGAEDPVGMMMADINLKELERKLLDHPFVDRAQVFKDVSGRLNVNVGQCRPIARFLKDRGNDLYMSDKGEMLPLSNKFTARVLPVDCAFTDKFKEGNPAEEETLKPYFDLMMTIHQKEFLRAQIAQMWINSKGEIALHTVVGDHVIELGGPERMDEKLKALQIFYNKILPVKGWNKYNRVCLKYKNQIICE